MTLEEDKVQNNKNNPHNENSLLNDIFYILENKKCSESEGIQFPDSNLEVLQYLKESTQKRIIKENNKRKKIIYSLIKKYGSNPDVLFYEIFGFKSEGMQMEIRSYGIYFYSFDYSFFQQVEPAIREMFHGGIVVDDRVKTPMKKEEFRGIVGFGSKPSSEHEFVHLFNSMTSLKNIQSKLNEIKTDIHRSTDEENIRSIKTIQYALWANSFMKDELLSRIDNNQILDAKEQDFDDPYSGGGNLFTTYEPAYLYGYMSDLRLFTSPYGIEPISKKQADEFYETYHKIFDPIRRKYLNIYNKNIRAIKQAINIGISKQKIKAILIETPFSEIAGKIINL